MPTRTQRLLWTALPNGFGKHGRLRVSAMLSPRLVVTPGPDDQLASFPDMLHWASIVRDAQFEIEFGGTTVTADRVSEPDDATYSRLFSSKTAIWSRVFEDRRGTNVLSFPVAAVEGDIAEVYGQLAVLADGELPLLDLMRRRFLGLGRALLARSPRDLLEQIRDGAPLDRFDTPDQRLNLVDLYNTPLAAPETHSYLKTGPEDPREDVSWETYRNVPLPTADTFQRSVDFHQIVTGLAQHPLLLRLTGLVADLEVDRDAFPPGPQTAEISVRVSWDSLPETAAGGVTILSDVEPRTLTVLDGRVFEAASTTPTDPPQVDGFVKLMEHGYDVSQLDVNGAALKLRQFAVNMFQLPPVTAAAPGDETASDPVAAQPERTGTPALRSGGLTLARRRRAAELEGRFARSGALDDALTAGTSILLHQEDLLRGYHVEVLDETAKEWRALGRRDTHYTFVSDHATVESKDNEGTVRLAASGSADENNADILKLYEGLFTWSGWSLAAPPIGRVVAGDDSVRDADGGAPEGLPLEVDHYVHPRSLPSLRFGRRYSFRLRVVDLAGNARRFNARLPSPPRAQTERIMYLRFEPVGAPTIALVGSGATVAFPGAGEDLATVAIRSLNATEADNAVASLERAARHVVPPLSSQRHAEQHGMLDNGGRIDPTTYALLVSRDASVAEATHPITGKGYPAAPAGFALPFLPDPLALESVIRIYGRTAPESLETIRVPWYPGGAAWPNARPFRLDVFEPASGATAAAPEFDEASGVLHMPLAKADQARVRIGHLVSDEGLTLLGLWRWALARVSTDAAAQARLTDLARDGQHWMLTPWRDIEIVHAVQKPLVVPKIEALSILRSPGSTVASLAFETPIDTRSTEKLDLVGRWLEPIDSLAQTGPRSSIGGGHRAAELKLERLEAPGVTPAGRRRWTQRGPVSHDFGDTRYRRVGYKLTATTRFTRFLPAPLQDPVRADELTVTSDETIGFVPNAAPPPAPDVVYVIPTFGWSRSGNDTDERSWRDGGGLRVYLRRPWLVSGYMEMLAVVLPRAGELSAEPSHSTFVTQWGADPSWRSAPIHEAAPPPNRFALAVTEGPIPHERLDPVIPEREADLPAEPFPVTGLRLPGVPTMPLVDVAPHLVGWDAERGLWYADIVVDPGATYAPFIRLALARYQPISAPGAHLSPVATTEVVQLLPDRLAVLTRTDPLTCHVGVYGHGPQHRHPAVEFAVERLPNAATTDLAWEPLPGVTVENAPPPPQERSSPGGSQPLPRLSPLHRRPTPGEPPLSRGAESRSSSESSLAEARDLLARRRFHELVVRPDLVDLLRPPLLREAIVRLPREREEGERFRLVITELELRAADEEHLDPPPEPSRDPRRRVVYLETIEL